LFTFKHLDENARLEGKMKHGDTEIKQMAAQGAITVRHPKWDFSDINNLDEFGTFNKLLWYSLSLVFPEGERYFIRSVKKFQDQIADPKLQAEIKAFIAQEAQHGRMHELFNNELILKQNAVATPRGEQRKEGLWWVEEFISKYITPKLNLAMTAAAEHYTATWAQNAFDDERVKELPDSLRNLIYWHAIEEIEHKHVAFDVMEKVDGSYTLRIAGMVVQTVLMGTNIPSIFLALLAKEETVDYVKLAGDVFKESTSEKGLIRNFARAFFSYLKPGFHPNDTSGDRLRAEAINAELEQHMRVA
jgi:uncharacterized protein